MQPRLPRLSLPTAEELGLMDEPSYPSFPSPRSSSRGAGGASTSLGAVAAQQFFQTPRPQTGPMKDEILASMQPKKDEPDQSDYGLYDWKKLPSALAAVGKGIVGGLNWYDENVGKPVTALGALNPVGPFAHMALDPDEKERQNRTGNIVHQVTNGQISPGEAWDQLADIQRERPFAMQLATELIYDPLNIVGGPVLKAPKTAFQAGAKGLRRIGATDTTLTPLIDAAESAITPGLKTAEQGYKPAPLPELDDIIDRVYSPDHRTNKLLNSDIAKYTGIKALAGLFNPNAFFDGSDVAKLKLGKEQYEEIGNELANVDSLRLAALMDGQFADEGFEVISRNPDFSVDIMLKSDIGNIPPSSARLAQELPQLFKEAVEAKYYVPSKIPPGGLPAGATPGITFDLGRMVDSDVFLSAAARIGITPAALRSYMETSRRQVVRELAKQGNLGVQTKKLTNVRVRELLQDAELQKRVHILLSNPSSVGSPIIRNAIDEAINVAVKREGRRQPRPVYFNEIMQNPELYNLTPGQLRTVNEINNVFAGYRNLLLDTLKAIPGADITDIDDVLKPVKGNYFPNIWKMYDDMGYLKETGDASIFNQTKGYENSRLFDYTTDALNVGKRPIDPIQAINITLRGMMQHMAEAKLAPIIGAWSPVAMKRIKEGIRLDTDDLIKTFKTDPATKKVIRDMLKPQSDNVLKKFIDSSSSISITMRTMQSAFDFGAPLIHGLPVLLSDPVLWGKSVKNAFAAMRDETVIQRLVSEHTETIQKLNSHNMLHGGASDLIEGLYGQKSGTLGRYASRRRMKGTTRGTEVLEPETGFQRVRRGTAKQTLGKVEGIQRQFEAFLLSSKIGLWESMEGMIPKYVTKQARKKGIIEGTPEYTRLQREAEEILSGHIAKMTGTVSMANLGLSPSRRKFLTGFVMYAPRYRMATLGLMADVFRGGMKSELAITRLSKMMMAGTYYYSLTAYKLNQEPQLNPFEPGFMSLKVGNTNIGIGSAYMSILNFLTQVASAGIPIDNDKYNGESYWESLDERTLDGLGAGLKHIRSQLAPLTGTGLDITSGRNYSGEPLPENYLKRAGVILGDGMLPFYASGLYEHPKGTWSGLVTGDFDTSIASIGAGAAGGFFGLRDHPMQSYAKAMDLAKIEVQKMAEESNWEEGDEPWEYHDLTKAQKNIIRSRNPRIDELLKEHNDSISIKPMTSDEEEERTELYSAWDTLSRMKKNQLENLKVIDQFGNEADASQMINQYIRDTDWKEGDQPIYYSGENYRDHVNEIFSDMRVRYDDLNEKYPLGIDKINSDMETKIRNGRINDFDAIYHKYINDVVTQDYDRANGEFNYRQQKINEEQFINSLPINQKDELWSYIMARKLQGFNPILENMKVGQRIMEPYWSIGDKILETLNLGADYGDKLERYRNAPRFEQDMMVQQDPSLKTIISAITKARQNIRRQNASIDAWLVRWGYTEKPLNFDNISPYYNDNNAFMTESINDLPDW